MYNIIFGQILYLHEEHVLECAKISFLDELDFFFFLMSNLVKGNNN